MIKTTDIRISLTRFFGTALSIILALFLLISWLTFSRLVNFESVLKNISEKALPEIVLSGELYNEASKLLQFTDLLANAKSDAAKRLAEQELNNYIREIKSLSNQKLNDSFLDKQLEVINLELLEFSDLIWQRANISKKLNDKRTKMTVAFSQAFEIFNEQSNTQNNVAMDTHWLTEISQLMITAEHAVNATRMQEVRGLFSQVKQQLNYIKSHEHKQNQSFNKQNIIKKLEQYLLAKDGLETLVITHLQLSGRVIGRENFMRHLIEDFSRLLEITTDETKTNIFNQLALSVRDTKQQTNQIGIIIVVAIILMFGMLVFIQQRILKRLQHFNLMVKNKTRGLEYNKIIKGNDEITDLAKAFNKFADTIEMQNEKLEQMSMTDGLTNIANRRALDIRLQHDIELSVRQKSSVAVLLIDIDYFKLYNDNYGHSAGDKCLKSVASTLSEVLQRESDFIARYGGEEFVCILPNTNQDGAQEITTHIFDALHTVNLPHKYNEISDRITISIGIAISSPEQILMPETIIKRADLALYRAKSAGKNNYKFYSE